MHQPHAGDQPVGRRVLLQVVERSAAALRGDRIGAVLDEAVGIEQRRDVLACRAPALRMARAHHLRPRRIGQQRAARMQLVELGSRCRRGRRRRGTRRTPSASGATSISVSPSSTASPRCTWIACTTPSVNASIGNSIFIDSRRSSTAPRATVLPTSASTAVTAPCTLARWLTSDGHRTNVCKWRCTHCARFVMAPARVGHCPRGSRHAPC